MKQKIQFIFASFIHIFAVIVFNACSGDDWVADDSLLTDTRYGSLTNHHVVASGEVQNVTHNSATILCSANYNYKEDLNIKPGIIYSDVTNHSLELTYNHNNTTYVEVRNFTCSEYEVTLSNLKPYTTYYYRAYARIKNKGRDEDVHGEIKSFTTSFDFSSIEAVDLGLSVKWASMNIGALHSDAKGDGFYWGGTEATSKTREQADWHDFSLATLKTKGYIDNDNNLCPSYDAATQLWGNEWRMPTKDEFQELIDKCSWKYISKNNQSVMLITGPNGNTISLPNGTGYWSSTTNYNSSYYLWTNYSNKRIETSERCVAREIRPVLK